MLVDNITSSVNEVAHGVDQSTIKVKFVIVARVLSHVMPKATLDPADVELGKLEQLRGLLVHDLPEVEHNLAFTFSVTHNVSSLVNQVAGRIDHSTEHIYGFVL